MKDIQQLIKKNSQQGRYEDIFPKTFVDAVLDRESGVTLTDILAMFNMLFLSYNGSRSQTRLQVPSSLRRKGLWVTYVLYNKTVVTEWYSAEAIDDTTFGDSANWRDGSNALVGDISISSDGYWVINGEVTNIKAQGEAGITPILRVGSNNHLQVSYTNGSTYVDVSSNPVFTQFRVSNNKLEQSVDLGLTWTVASDYIAAWFRFTGTTGSSQADNVGKMQISRDNGATWSDLSGEFTNSLHIKGYVATVGALPSTAVQGDIYGVGPTYDTSDTEHTNPIYQLYVKNSTGWVNNGRFTSISAGVVQELGDSETAVMSQKATTDWININNTLFPLLSEVLKVDIVNISSIGNLRGYYNSTNGIFIEDESYNSTVKFKVRKGDSIQFVDSFGNASQVLGVARWSLSNDYLNRLSNINSFTTSEDCIIAIMNQRSIEVYIRKDSSIPTLEETVTDNSKAVLSLNSLKEAIPVTITYDGIDDYSTYEKITLSKDGDSIEFLVSTTCNTLSRPSSGGNGGYAFTQGDSVSGIAVGIAKTGVGVRATNGTWLCLAQSLEPLNLINIKIEYQNGKVLTYRNGTLLSTYEGQLPFSISRFGNGSNGNNGYWEGTIYSVNNNSVYSLKDFVNYGGTLKINQDNDGKNLIYYEKDTDLLKVFIPSINNYYICYPLNYRYKSYSPDEYPSYYDNWGIGKVSLYVYEADHFKEVDDLFRGSECELAMNVKSSIASRYGYVGGVYHGFENIQSSNGRRNITFLVDNSLIEENSISSGYCRSIQVKQGTQLVEAYTNSNPFADVVKMWRFSIEGVEFSNDVSIIRDIHSAQSQFNMMGVFRHLSGIISNPYLTNRVIKDNTPFKIFNTSDGWESLPENSELLTIDADCSQITSYGDYGIGFSMKILKDNRYPTGGMFLSTNNSTYNKVYFDITGDADLKIGDKLHSHSLWTILGSPA